MRLHVIAGPTASGKTERAIERAREHGGEIVSVDSRQVYRQLSIGTAKPGGRWEDGQYRVQGIAFHFVDILEPDQSFSAAEFARQAEPLIQSIEGRGHQPILVGGTGLYFKAYFEGLAELPHADAELRARLRDRAEKKGREALHKELADVDPLSAARIPANNIQRVLRALEVFELTGKPLSAWHRDQLRKPAREYDLEYLDPGKSELDKRIAARCRWMLDHGMIEETEALMSRGVAPNCPALSGLGYPRVLEFLGNRIARDELLDLLIRDTRQYAKRQRTWFRHQLLKEPA